MTNIPPIFPIHQPHHFSDYGFDPHFDYFQVLELEARNHKHSSSSSSFRSAIDNLHFKLQKPISIDEKSKNIKKSRKRWWNNALHFFKRKRPSTCTGSEVRTNSGASNLHSICTGSGVRAKSGLSTLHSACTGSGSGVGTVSAPVYSAECRSSRCSTPYHRTRKGDLNIPYISLNEVHMDQTHKISNSAVPIYLVT